MKINTDKPYKIFADVIESEAIAQFESAMQQPFTVKGALMPDAHTGYTLPIGAVIAAKDFILPSWVGYDIGCGMCALKLPYNIEKIRENSQRIFGDMYRNIPTGFDHNKKETPWPEYDNIPKSDAAAALFEKNGLLQLGSLGGGNHFIEIGHSSENIWAIIHSGSRGVGHAIATFYMRTASGDGKAREGHFGFSDESDLGLNYINDMNMCLEFALKNRLELMKRIVEGINHVLKVNVDVDFGQIINRNHNHAEKKNGLWIHRKGATHAEKGMYGVIPGNMRDGSFIVRGKGNEESLCSSSHGAGRVLSRKKARDELSLDAFKITMEGITAKVKPSTIDESPFAYKNIFDVMALQSDLVETLYHITPIINIKG